MSDSMNAMRQEVLTVRYANEKAEVLLKNLLQLKNKECDGFRIPFDDVVITIEAAIDILKDS